MPPMLVSLPGHRAGSEREEKEDLEGQWKIPPQAANSLGSGSDALDNDYYHFLCVQRWEDVGKCC